MDFMFVPLLVANIISYIPWSIIFIFTKQFLGIHLYHITRKEECVRIQKRVQGSLTVDGGKSSGYAMGKWYILHIQTLDTDYNGSSYTIYMIATEYSYKKLTKDIEEEEPNILLIPNTEEPQSSKISVVDRTGSFSNVWFRKRDRTLHDTPKPSQATILSMIKKHHTQYRHTVAYIYGPPGTGKSMIGLLLAKELNAIFCNSLKPWQPGDTLGILYSEMEPSQKTPLVLVFDEFDSVLERLHGGIQEHKNIPIAIRDKPGWNYLLDEIQRGMYPDLILILTSNKEPHYINSLDPSYIRANRVDIQYEMTEPILKNIKTE